MTTPTYTAQCLVHHLPYILEAEYCPAWAPYSECRPECPLHPGGRAEQCLGCRLDKPTLASDVEEFTLALRELGNAILEAFRPVADWLQRSIDSAKRWRGRV